MGGYQQDQGVPVPEPMLHPAEQSAGAFCRPLACVSSARRL